ncbi:GTPase Era, mitochondrial [Nylanderia fulva]|uniref:GTPase Era, mitochondrial n=1 Tax=Nylanderia fulva TaxID=613905 RepID=UPI0010FBAFF5|nr:GTPase Era, mitochondrial [Nylanderia fulva]
MLFTIEKYVIRVGSRYLRRYFSRTVDATKLDSQTFIRQSDDTSTSIRRESQKSLRIAILGAPNAGKSTLVNQLIKRTVCPASSKVHTTQTKADAIYCESDTQLIFMDTPGVVSTTECKRYNLANTFKNDPKVSLAVADIVGIVQDAQNMYTRHNINSNILEILTEKILKKIPMILILNKIDKLKKKEVLLQLASTLVKKKDSLKFSDVFMVSALTGDGIDDLRTYLLDSAKPRDWQYEEHMYSNHKCEDIIQQTVRAKLMDMLPHEIPYSLKVKLEHFEPGPEDSVMAMVSVACPKKNIAKLLLRKNKTFGNRIKQVAVMSEQELRHAFRTPVRLKLIVNFPT